MSSNKRFNVVSQGYGGVILESVCQAIGIRTAGWKESCTAGKRLKKTFIDSAWWQEIRLGKQLYILFYKI